MSKHCHIYVAATSLHSIVIDMMLFKRCVSTGVFHIYSYIQGTIFLREPQNSS